MAGKSSPRTALLAAVLAAAVLLAAYAGLWLYRDEVSVEGGIVLATGDGLLEVRCLAPEVSLSLRGFEGQVVFRNAFPGSGVEGFGGTVERSGTNISFLVAGGRADYRLVAPAKSDFSFAVVGDSQGHNEILAQALDMAGGVDFVIHCGDLTPSGRDTEYAATEFALNASSAPVFVTPGNHDIRNEGPDEFASRFGPTQYGFDYGGVRFAFVDSSDLNISEDEIGWLTSFFAGADAKVVVTHAPSFDPFEYNHTLDAASCDRFQAFVLDEHVDAVFNGHVHAFYQMTVDDTCFTITGGGGGSLTDGVHHFVLVNRSSGGFEYEKVDLDGGDVTAGTDISIVGHGSTANLTYDELLAMAMVEGMSSYENLYGNVGGLGYYEGVTFASLLDLVGGLQDGEVLRVTSSDGYYQDFGYLNIYPDDAWLGLQGQMTLALWFDNTTMPDWEDGPRIAFLPDDGFYSNEDCEATSYPGQGYDLYPSAGARWAKNVFSIAILEAAS